jgi:hypothetical protein
MRAPSRLFARVSPLDGALERRGEARRILILGAGLSALASGYRAARELNELPPA